MMPEVSCCGDRFLELGKEKQVRVGGKMDGDKYRSILKQTKIRGHKSCTPGEDVSFTAKHWHKHATRARKEWFRSK